MHHNHWFHVKESWFEYDIKKPQETSHFNSVIQIFIMQNHCLFGLVHIFTMEIDFSEFSRWCLNNKSLHLGEYLVSTQKPPRKSNRFDEKRDYHGCTDRKWSPSPTPTIMMRLSNWIVYRYWGLSRLRRWHPATPPEKKVLVHCLPLYVVMIQYTFGIIIWNTISALKSENRHDVNRVDLIHTENSELSLC